MIWTIAISETSPSLGPAQLTVSLTCFASLALRPIIKIEKYYYVKSLQDLVGEVVNEYFPGYDSDEFSHFWLTTQNREPSMEIDELAHQEPIKKIKQALAEQLFVSLIGFSPNQVEKMAS